MNPEDENIDLTDSLDTQILMHRDAHFGGKFVFMLDYYSKEEGKGINPEFTLQRIGELQRTESHLGQNLSAVMLSGADAEKVARACLAYKNLKSLYEAERPASRLPRLIADLILSEEEEPEDAIQAIVAEKSAIVPLLIDLLRSSDFADPLFPGYGHAPALAAVCLGRIGDKRSLISLFEAIGEGDFFNEDLILDALKSIGDPAKEFLLKVVRARPINFDNDRAAIALERFKEDEAVSKACLELLCQEEIRKNSLFSTYLALACEGLTSSSDREQFIGLADEAATSKQLARDIKAMAKNWT